MVEEVEEGAVVAGAVGIEAAEVVDLEVAIADEVKFEPFLNS